LKEIINRIIVDGIMKKCPQKSHMIPPDHLFLDRSQILDHSILVGNLTHPKIAETKALEPLKS
jgi:hypothetical protein